MVRTFLVAYRTKSDGVFSGAEVVVEAVMAVRWCEKSREPPRRLSSGPLFPLSPPYTRRQNLSYHFTLRSGSWVQNILK